MLCVYIYQKILVRYGSIGIKQDFETKSQYPVRFL